MFRVFSKTHSDYSLHHASIEDKFLMDIKIKLFRKGGPVKCYCFVNKVGYWLFFSEVFFVFFSENSK